MSDPSKRTMIERHLRARGIVDPRVLAAFDAVPRERFVPPSQIAEAYEDMPLPIGEGQTISQPYVVAFMVEALGLAGHERVLDVGTGSGYAAAILARVASEVVSIERHASLAAEAARTLEELGIANVEVLVGDGTLGAPSRAPFDAILVSAAGPSIPPALVAQLAPGGRLVIPVGATPDTQHLVRVTRGEDGIRSESIGEVRFVPLIGEGWD